MNMEAKYDYKNLDAYKESKILVRMVYEMLKQFPKEEQYALCDQLRRAVISIPSNLAEGCGRYSTKEQLHFLESLLVLCLKWSARWISLTILIIYLKAS